MDVTKCTPGPWAVNDDMPLSVLGPDFREGPIASTAPDGINYNELRQQYATCEANAQLIAEAGTVAHETGLSPRQLAERYAEAVRVVDLALACAEQSFDAKPDWADTARAVLDKAQP